MQQALQPKIESPLCNKPFSNIERPLSDKSSPSVLIEAIFGRYGVLVFDVFCKVTKERKDQFSMFGKDTKEGKDQFSRENKKENAKLAVCEVGQQINVLCIVETNKDETCVWLR